MGTVKIATYNVNGVNGRLPVLLRWLGRARPDIVCLQELKSPQERFPKRDLEKAGYGAIWHGQKAWNGVAILAKGMDPVETRRGLPGGPEDLHSRYIEAAVGGLLIACLYLPNGNPAPGPKFYVQARLVLAPAQTREDSAEVQAARRLGRGFQRHADRSRCLCPGALA